MHISTIDIVDVFVFSLPNFCDARGVNTFPFQAKFFRQALGRDMSIAQVNTTSTLAGTFRGIHYALVPPGQAKYVFINSGSCIDYLIDLRCGSPTFLTVVTIPLTARDARNSPIAQSDGLPTSQAIYIPEGIGHGIYAPEEPATITYLCSREYNPEVERGITPLDPALQLNIDQENLVLSPKDCQAPLLADAVLPSYATCQQWYRQQ